MTFWARNFVDLAEVGRPGGAVGEGDPVEEDGRGERPQHEVLDRRLSRLGAPGVVAGQHVQGDGEDLQPQEQHDQVVGARHEHGARRREHGQHVELGAVEAFLAQVGVGRQGRHDERRSDQQREEHAEPVHGDGSGDRRVPAPSDVVPQQVGVGHRGTGGGHGEDGVGPSGQRAALQRRHGHEHQRQADQEQLGHDGRVVDARQLEGRQVRVQLGEQRAVAHQGAPGAEAGTDADTGTADDPLATAGWR